MKDNIKHTDAINNPEIWDEFHEICRKLHLPTMEGYWELEVSIDGKIIDTRKERSGSYLRNFYNLITCQTLSSNGTSTTVFGNGELSFKNTAGTITGSIAIALAVNQDSGSAFSFPAETLGSYGFRANVADATYGIQVGTGSTGVSFNDYKLETLITEGLTAGKMSYQTMSSPGKEWINSILKYNIGWERYINNNSGGDITVNEVGLTASTRSYSYVIMERHVIAGGLLVPNTAQLLCKYSLGLTFP